MKWSEMLVVMLRDENQGFCPQFGCSGTKTTISAVKVRCSQINNMIRHSHIFDF